MNIGKAFKPFVFKRGCSPVSHQGQDGQVVGDNTEDTRENSGKSACKKVLAKQRLLLAHAT